MLSCICRSVLQTKIVETTTATKDRAMAELTPSCAQFAREKENRVARDNQQISAPCLLFSESRKPADRLIHSRNRSISCEYRTHWAAAIEGGEGRAGTIARIFAPSPPHQAVARGLVVVSRQTGEAHLPCVGLCLTANIPQNPLRASRTFQQSHIFRFSVKTGRTGVKVTTLIS